MWTDISWRRTCRPTVPRRLPRPPSVGRADGPNQRRPHHARSPRPTWAGALCFFGGGSRPPALVPTPEPGASPPSHGGEIYAATCFGCCSRSASLRRASRISAELAPSARRCRETSALSLSLVSMSPAFGGVVGGATRTRRDRWSCRRCSCTKYCKGGATLQEVL